VAVPADAVGRRTRRGETLPATTLCTSVGSGSSWTSTIPDDDIDTSDENIGRIAEDVFTERG
jgi:hypothetical protein